MDFEKLIPTGSDNAVSMHDLSLSSGLDERSVRKAIELLRRSGQVIVSNEHGYFFPDGSNADYIEVRNYVARMTQRAETTFLCLHGARALLRKFDGQQTLRGFFDES